MDVSNYNHEEGNHPNGPSETDAPYGMPTPGTIRRVDPGKRAPSNPPLKIMVRKFIYRYLDTPKKRQLAALVVLFLLLFSYLLFPFIFHRQPQLSAYSTKWNGLSDLKDLVEKEGYDIQSIISSPTLLEKLEDGEDIENTLLVIMGAERRYSKEEAEAIEEFVEDGGKLLLGDDLGYGSRVSGFLGVTFHDARLFDDNYQKNWSFIEPRTNMPGRDYSLLLNRPSALSGTGDARIWATSSSGNGAFLDFNGNSRGDDGEYADSPGNPGSFKLIAKKEYDGGGEAVFIADSSIFMNDMLDRAENREFASFVLEDLLGGEGTVIFEESSHIQSGVYRSSTHSIFYAMLFSGSHPVTIIICITVLLLSLEIAIVRQKNPKRWIHTFRTEGKISRLSIPPGHYLRPEVIRQIFMERVRLQAGMSPEEFSRAAPGTISQVVKSDRLMDFIQNPDKYDNMTAMKSIVKIARRWNI